MGLLTNAVASSMPEKRFSDEVIMFHAMLIVAVGDGVLEDTEKATVESYYLTIPELRKWQFGDLFQQHAKLVAKYGSLQESINALSEIQSQNMKFKTFIICVDVALASGDVSPKEDELLEAMQRILGIDDTFARNTASLLAIKYAA